MSIPGSVIDSAPAAPGTRRVGWFWSAVVIGVLVVALLVWTLGGFTRRTDRFRPTPPGTLIATGPYEFRFSEATAQEQTSYDGTKTWEVSVLGEGRTTGADSITPDFAGSDVFAAKDDVTGEVQIPDHLHLAEVGRQTERDAFVPGLPAVPVQIVFDFSDRFRPGSTLRFAVADQVFENRYLVGGEEEWHATADSWILQLPLRVLPPEQT